MNKKIIVLFLMLCSTETKPFGIVEVLAVIGFGAIVKKPVQRAVKSAWSRYAKQPHSEAAQIPPRGGVRDLSKIDPSLTQRLKLYCGQVQEAVLQGTRNLPPILADFRSRLDQGLAIAAQESKTTISSQRNYFSSAYKQPSNRATDQKVAQKDDAAPTVHVTQVNAQQQNNQAFGLFPRVTNNYYSGKAEEVVEEIGKKKFWQGAFFGTVATAWLLKPSAESRKDKKSN